MNKTILHKTALVILLALAFVFLYNIPTLISISRPLITRVTYKSGGLTAEPDQLVYPTLGIMVPVKVLVASPLNIADWGQIRQQLTEGSAYTLVGDLGVITAHSADIYPHPYSSVFAALGQAKVGDEFAVNLGTNNIYQVILSTQVRPNDVEKYLHNITDPKNKLVLVTCWPPMTTANRMLVVGALTTSK